MMQARFGAGAGSHNATLPVRAARLGLLVLPVTLLLLAALRCRDEPNLVLWLGTLFQGLACALALVTRRGGREINGSAIIMLYVIALSWLLLGSAGRDDWFLHLSQAALLVVPLLFFGAQCLTESGAPALRRARQLAGRLARRTDWPTSLEACRRLPEVKALREALHVDASPALALLSDRRPEVRVAALAALEFRQNWQRGQADVVLNLARNTQEPEVRATAINALANLDDRLTIEALAVFLADPSPLVRHAATEALFWNTEYRWPWIRLAVRHALADPVCQDDGPLRNEGHLLTAYAVADLTAWAAEKGLLALRAALTLGVHYALALARDTDSALVMGLRRQLTNGHTPAMLRLELARLLHQHRELDDETLRALLDPSSPAPVRLIAAEALLSEGESVEAVAALHDLARLPNREIALATAEVVQRRLGVDLGMPRGQAPPPVQSRLAAEVARRVLLWASQQEMPDDEPPAASRAEEPAWRSLSEM
jgi:HEAT repeat protein